MRPLPSGLLSFLLSKQPSWPVDLFTISTLDFGVLYLTSANVNVTDGSGTTWQALGPQLTRSSWTVKNTVDVPQMVVKLLSTGTDYNGGANIKLMIHNGMFAGAAWTLTRMYMTSPPVIGQVWSSPLGTVPLFTGITGEIKLSARGADITVNGRNVKIQGYLPKNVFTRGCIHALYDQGCTLNPAAFTISQTVGAGSTAIFINWGGAVPANPALYSLGTIEMTDGVASGQSRSILAANSTGIQLSYPLYETPATGDTLNVVRGCAHTQAACKTFGTAPNGNIANYRGFPFTPPAQMAQ